MTKLEAVQLLLSKLHIPGVLIHQSEDSSEYTPPVQFLDCLETLVGSPVTESDLNFYVGGALDATYSIKPNLIAHIDLTEKDERA